MFDRNDWDEDAIAVRDDSGKPTEVEGRTWKNFGLVEKAAFDALEPRWQLIHITSQIELGVFDDRDAATRAATLLAIVGDWNDFRWPLTREEVGLLWFRSGLFPRPEASKPGKVVWVGTPPAWTIPSIPDLVVEPPNAASA